MTRGHAARAWSSGLARGTLAAVVLAGLLAAGGAGAVPVALAACAPPPPIEQAVVAGPIVFVGTVVRLENGGRWATVRVEERWNGARDLPATVVVRGGPDPGTASEIDRVYREVRYLFVVQQGPGYLVDTSCSSTTAWSDELAPLRPPGVTPAPAVEQGEPLVALDIDQLMPVIGLVFALLVALVAYLAVLRGRRRPPDWMR